MPRAACAPVRATAAGPFWKPSSRAPRRRTITPSSASPMRTDADGAGRRQYHASRHRRPLLALRFAEPAATSLASLQSRPAPQIREPMRAEIERLVEEIKQSVGLLRRHL